MTLHIFNPDHDLALASGLENFTAPHAGRQLRHDLGWLPALWADADDYILVDDVAAAERGARRRPVRCRRFVSCQQLSSLPISRIEPWGWNVALCAYLRRHGIENNDYALHATSHQLKTKEELDTIRQLSHRRTAALLLPLLQGEGTVGEAIECTTQEEALSQIARYGQAVLKAPWSSSGRGVRFVSSGEDRSYKSYETYESYETHKSYETYKSYEPHKSHETYKSHKSHESHPSYPLDKNIEGWLRNTLLRQGSVMVEPQYTKVKDFGMEFFSDGAGHVSYLGLSLFHTSNGAYTGNVIATEQAKREALSHYLPTLLLDQAQERICQLLGNTFKDKYCGPFGIDMMVVKSDHLSPLTAHHFLHPCVEINLRRTMGHVALALGSIYNPSDDDEVRHVMRINYSNNNYKLQIKRQ